MKQIQKILIANRGEIAVRIMRTAKRMGIRTVAIYSEIDHDSLHVALADEASCIGHSDLSETYLNIGRIIETAKDANCDAIHPGYGFLAENPLFVKACHDAGIIFIGPGPEAMKVMGNKIEAREFVKRTGVPMTEGVNGSPADLIRTAPAIGFPVLLKAAAGGGGKGMRVVYEPGELQEAIESASRQAKAYFGDDTVYIEKYIEEPRHIEVQILGDEYGNIIHLFERECSIQRRYQKIIEESPSPTLNEKVRRKMGEAAVRIGKEAKYSSAGTIEFLVDKNLNFYFLEMNTRIQVEHPVTELVTGIDIVEEQIHIASGQKLRFTQDEIRQTGHAIECRIYAEDPSNNFRPSPGQMSLYIEPRMPGIRVDSGMNSATEVKSSFDPMISKLVVYGKDRDEARLLGLAALKDYTIHGIRTNITFLSALLESQAFISNSISTKFCDEHLESILTAVEEDKKSLPLHIPVVAYLLASLSNTLPGNCSEKPGVWQQIGYWRDLMKIRLYMDDAEMPVKILKAMKSSYVIELSGQKYEGNTDHWENNRLAFTVNGHDHIAFISEDKDDRSFVSIEGIIFRFRRADLLTENIPAGGQDEGGAESGHITSPMPGKVIKINVTAGDKVKKGQVLLIIEAMKMENLIAAPAEGVVQKVNVGLNQMVETSMPLLDLERI